jgi:hypothetical protein
VYLYLYVYANIYVSFIEFIHCVHSVEIKIALKSVLTNPKILSLGEDIRDPRRFFWTDRELDSCFFGCILSGALRF